MYAAGLRLYRAQSEQTSCSAGGQDLAHFDGVPRGVGKKEAFLHHNRTIYLCVYSLLLRGYYTFTKPSLLGSELVGGLQSSLRPLSFAIAARQASLQTEWLFPSSPSALSWKLPGFAVCPLAFFLNANKIVLSLRG